MQIDRRTPRRAGLAALILAAVLVTPTLALAQPGGPHHGPEPRPHHGPRYYDALPGNCVAILVDGIRFFYGLGVFYRMGPGGYMVVDAPYGAVVPRLPPGCGPVMVAGTTYYVLNGVYYLPQPPGYVVVNPPVVVNQPVVVQPAPQATQSQGLPNQMTVIIQNPNGSKTPVTLERTPDGWKGPKGEIYETLPDANQLAPYYGLNAKGETL